MSTLARYANIQLTTLECIKCGLVHSIPQAMYNNFRRIGGFWYCPNGHMQGWDKGEEHTKIKALEAEVEQQRSIAARNLARYNEEATTNRALNTVLKSTRTRLRNVKLRVANGICPCCNRTFVNLQRHMHTKHPEFKGDEQGT